MWFAVSPVDNYSKTFLLRNLELLTPANIYLSKSNIYGKGTHLGLYLCYVQFTYVTYDPSSIAGNF
jgi:hypothetical protein